jgi:hypothetical protein
MTLDRSSLKALEPARSRREATLEWITLASLTAHALSARRVHEGPQLQPNRLHRFRSLAARIVTGQRRV